MNVIYLTEKRKQIASGAAKFRTDGERMFIEFYRVTIEKRGTPTRVLIFAGDGDISVKILVHEKMYPGDTLQISDMKMFPRGGEYE